MIYTILGKIVKIEEDFIVLDIGKISFKIFCSENTLKKCKIGEEKKFFVFLYKREDILNLYGFLDEKELKLFEILESISGIGPKAALSLSVFGSLENLKKALEKEDFYRKIKGVGRKKIQKIILEISGKIKEVSLKEKERKKDEAIEALVSLGFSRSLSKQVLSEVPSYIKDPKERIKEALKILGKKRGL